MSEFAEIPAFAPGVRPPVPEAYDRRSYAADGPDAGPLAHDADFCVYAVEVRSPRHPGWELRPLHEYRAGRAFAAHYQRLFRISGFWHQGALVFSDEAPAHEAAGALTTANPGFDFRVVQIRVTRTRTVLTPLRVRTPDAAAARLAALVATQSDTDRLSPDLRALLADIAADLGHPVPLETDQRAA